MSFVLSADEARVLGSLIEKEMATPEYYPLSLNALVNACNQKSSREPITNYGEDEVRHTLESLRAKQLCWVISGRDMRVPKYSHRAAETLNIGNREQALLCIMLLRGPQTLNELKERTHRLYAFDDMESIENCLRRLAEREMVMQVQRSGMREPRWGQLLTGPIPEDSPAPQTAHESPAHPLSERVAALEREVQELREQLAEFKRSFE
jgi:uncharacterized protein YceH (UPF0502 family)